MKCRNAVCVKIETKVVRGFGHLFQLRANGIYKNRINFKILARTLSSLNYGYNCVRRKRYVKKDNNIN